MFTSYGSAFSSSFQVLWPAIINVAARLVIAIVLFIIGWIIGFLLEKVVEHIFKLIKVDLALQKAGIEEPLRRGGITLNSGKFVGALVKWFVIVLFLVSSFSILGLDTVNQFLAYVVLSYLPQVIISVLILLVSAVIGSAMQKIVQASASAAHLKSAHFLGTFTKWTIWILAIFTALLQLNIGTDIIRTIFTGVVVALSVAFGISFGLGGQNQASQVIDRVKREISSTDGR